MIKFLYVVSLGITSFLLFIFSKEKNEPVCNNQVSGMITLISDSTGSFLGVITDEDLTLRPSSINEDVVLTAGQKVNVCYNIDSSKFTPEQHTLPVHIRAISYFSE